MSYLVADIETIPDLTLWTPPPIVEDDPKKKDQIAPPQAQRPIVIGCLWLGENLMVKHLGIVGKGKLHGNERDLLCAWADFMYLQKPSLITWNGRSFDLPCLVLRAFRHGVQLPWYFEDKNYRYRYSDTGHIDLMDAMSEFGAVNRAGFKLDILAKAIGLPGKYGVDGSMVEGMYGTGRILEIETYCLTDVIQTAFVFLRWLFIKGRADLTTYQLSAAELLSRCEKEPRFAEFLSLIDRKSLLLSDLTPIIPAESAAPTDGVPPATT